VPSDLVTMASKDSITLSEQTASLRQTVFAIFSVHFYGQLFRSRAKVSCFWLVAKKITITDTFAHGI
jgi:hypothetical protein